MISDSKNNEFHLKNKILFVNDDEKLLEILTHRLENRHILYSAIDGNSALKIIKSGFEPDIIVSAQYLNDMNGAEFLRDTNKLMSNTVSMIIATNNDTETTFETISSSKAFIYLFKPINDYSIIESIEYCIRQRKINYDIEQIDNLIKPKVLIADDSKIMLKLMGGLLNTLNAMVFEANDGLEALKIIEKEQSFDLVILDIVMPNLDGFGTCKKIREVYSIYELPIIFLTSLSEPKDIVRGFDLGANDYLQKPFKSEELIARAKTLIKLRRLSQTTTSLKEVIETKNNTLSRLREEIANREDIEKQLIEQREKAISANQLKSEFLANMSHEIRTPLNAILGFSELLTTRIEDEKSKNYVDSIVTSGKNLLNLINDILDLSKIEANRVELEYTTFNLKNLILEVQGIFNLRAQAKGVELRTIIDDNLINSDVILDELRLRQILINLVGNAIKFTEKGYVEIKLTSELSNYDNFINLIIQINDSGIGIAPDQKEAIFEAFQQHSKQSHKAFGGTGLGLTISRKFINMMKGTISLESEIGNGSKFTISIPNVEITSTHKEESDYDKNLVFEFNKPKILLVDDNEHNRKLIIEFLSDSNVTIIEAENGEDAILAYIDNEIDAVLMDLVMPVMDGFEAIDQIKKLVNYNPKTPIIGLTALAFSSERDKILQKGFSSYLSKPIHKESLFVELCKYLPYTIIRDLDSNDIIETRLESEEIPESTLRIISNDLEELLEFSRELLKTRKTRQIKDFGSKVNTLGMKHNIAILINYSDKIQHFVQIYDMENVKRLLLDFNDLCNSLEIKK